MQKTHLIRTSCQWKRNSQTREKEEEASHNRQALFVILKRIEEEIREYD